MHKFPAISDPLSIPTGKANKLWFRSRNDSVGVENNTKDLDKFKKSAFMIKH
jgi:hypothetical protein